LASATPAPVLKIHGKHTTAKAISEVQQATQALPTDVAESGGATTGGKTISSSNNQTQAQPASIAHNYYHNNHSAKKRDKLFASNSIEDIMEEVARPYYESSDATNPLFNTPTSNNNSPNQPQNASTRPIITKDTFSQLRIVKHYLINPLTHESKLKLDTIFVGKIALDMQILSQINDNDQPLASVAPSENDFTDQLLLNAGISNHILPLSTFKIRSHHTSYWNTRSFYEVVNDFKFNVKQIKFYPGLSLGYNNYLVNTGSLNGFQVGFAGLFTLDSWALMTELKYFNRINSGFTLNDDYVESAGPGMQRKVDHFFKFSSLQSVEMPIAMRYTLNRLNIFAGINTAYFFGIMPEEVENIHVAEPITQGSFNAAPSVYPTDFDSRLAVGGLLGVSYDLLPALQLDLRTTRNIWDNNGSRGALIVAHQLFRVPSFQVSMVYHFSSKPRFPKAR
jgi:hypothetical protein